MNHHQVDYMYLDIQQRLAAGRRFRLGEPSGMLVAIAGLARRAGALAALIERWARRPEKVEYLPRIPAR